jgi:5-methylcytosine-specific restriction endonuclease McrA
VKICAACDSTFTSRLVIDGKLRYLGNRRFCLGCSPFGNHNSSRRPLVDRVARRRESWVRYSQRRRIRIKAELVTSMGGRCEDCGYDRSVWALDFHHRDPATKEFALGGFLGSIDRARRESEKCILVCANCHRIRHSRTKSSGSHPVVVFRRKLKRRAVASAGGSCMGCGLSDPVDVLDFHHLDPTTKEFAISTDGVPRSWARVQAELTKCVLLCANCHREVHAGVREVDEPLLGLAEPPGVYRAA